MKKIILVVDGQGGGIGRAVIERLKKESLDIEIIAVGTNSIATGTMLKAGADDAATGENAVIYNSTYADFIIGPIGLISANSLLGEISPQIAASVAQSSAVKLLIPMNRCNLYIAGASENGLSDKIEEVVLKVKELI